MKCTTMQEVEKFLPNSLIGTKKRKAEDDPLDTTCLFFEPKMQDEKRQKLQKFSRLKEQVEQAKRLLQNEPAKKNKKWNKQAAKHQALLKKAGCTACLFHSRSIFRNGHACPFSHEGRVSASTDGHRTVPRRATLSRNQFTAGKAGVLTKWKPPIRAPQPHGKGGYGFITISEDGEQVYVPGTILTRAVDEANIRQGMEVTVLHLKEDEYGGSSRVATKVQVVQGTGMESKVCG